MSKIFQTLYNELTDEIKKAYESNVTLEEAEKLASKFLYAQILISDEIRSVDLDCRMKKSGVKAVRAAVYLEEACKGDKKPSDVMLGALVDRNELVIGEQTSFDEAEVNKDALYNALSILKEAHVHFRQISKGRFE